jgi:mono/diheme cytochrome c family protein
MKLTTIRVAAASLLAICLVIPGCAPVPVQGADASLADSPEEATVAQGRQIAMTNCSVCHAIDDERTSPNPEAPPLLSILLRYDSERLAEDFVEGTRVGHDEMPHFDFTVREADALIAYLKSIEHTPRAAEN